MKLNPEFILHTSDSETLLVPTGNAPFKGVVRANITVRDILVCLQNETNEREIIHMLCDRYDGDPAIIAQDVSDTVAQLKSIGAIDE